jgi:hypothetical protein
MTTYSVNNISALTDVTALVLAFATARGWTVSGSTLQIPGGKTFQISVDMSAATNGGKNRIYITDVVTNSIFTWTSAPQLNGSENSPVVSNPTKLHLYGSDSPHTDGAYIGIIIEFGFNSFRHMYIGKVKKLGNYTDGDVISSNYFPQMIPQNFQSIANPYLNGFKYLFGAITQQIGGWSGPTGNQSGGVYVNHADNANTFRRFDSRFDQFAGNQVIGGHGDGINDTFVSCSNSPFAGGVILNPINLFAIKDNDTINYKIIPIGSINGVFLIDMLNLDVGQLVTIAGKSYRCFPELRKKQNPKVFGLPLTWFPEETSGNLGLAYLETVV